MKETEQKSYYRSKEERAQEAKRKTRVKKIEDEIFALETESEEINAALADPAVTGNYALLTEKCKRLEEIKGEIDALYEEYETLI